MSYTLPIGMGAMPLSIQNRPSEQKAMQIIAKFIELGGNFIDTADVYGLDENDIGHNERLIYKVLKKLGSLDTVLVATKGGATRPNGGWDFGGGHPKLLRKACEQSLLNLKRSAHPLYYLHGPDRNISFEDSIGELIQLKQEGKIINIGIANVNLEEIKLASHLTSLAAVQNRCNLFCKEDFKNGVIHYCQSNRILYVPYCPLGGWATHVKLAQSDFFQYFIKKYQMSYYSLCLAWLLHKGDFICPIPGMDKLNHVNENFQSLHLRIQTEDIAKLDAFPDLFCPKHS